MDEVFVISRIISVEVGSLTKTLIILDITKTYSTCNHCFIIQCTGTCTLNKNGMPCPNFITDCKQHKKHELDMITLRNHPPQSHMIWIPMTLGVLDMIIHIYYLSAARWHHRCWIEKFINLCALGQREKRLRVQCITYNIIIDFLFCDMCTQLWNCILDILN